jgi:hypothetical protein
MSTQFLTLADQHVVVAMLVLLNPENYDNGHGFTCKSIQAWLDKVLATTKQHMLKASIKSVSADSNQIVSRMEAFFGNNNGFTWTYSADKITFKYERIAVPVLTTLDDPCAIELLKELLTDMNIEPVRPNKFDFDWAFVSDDDCADYEFGSWRDIQIEPYTIPAITTWAKSVLSRFNRFRLYPYHRERLTGTTNHLLNNEVHNLSQFLNDAPGWSLQYDIVDPTRIMLHFDSTI